MGREQMEEEKEFMKEEGKKVMEKETAEKQRARNEEKRQKNNNSKSQEKWEKVEVEVSSGNQVLGKVREKEEKER